MCVRQKLSKARLDVGSSYLHIRYSPRQYGQVHIEVIGSGRDVKDRRTEKGPQ